MRLSARKISYLSEKILKFMQDHRRIHVVSPPDMVQRAIYDAIHANMMAEVEIDEEVDRLLGQHRGEIQAMDMDLTLLRQKMKREIARKRGFTL